MELFEHPLALITGTMPLPEGFSVIAPVTTEKFPIGAILLRNQAGFYWLWSGGVISSCDQREAAQFVAKHGGGNLIPLSEYAAIHGISPDTVRQKALRGGWKTAVKIGRNWFIEKNEPFSDLRKKAEDK